MAEWTSIKEALEQWQQARIEAVVEQQQLYAEKFQNDIIKGINGASKTSAMKKAPLAPGDNQNKNPLDGLDQYASSVIIDVDGDGIDTVHTIKIDNPRKKDETTEMELGKIAKAVEFGTRQIAPRSVWRRASNKMRATGIYKKDS